MNILLFFSISQDYLNSLTPKSYFWKNLYSNMSYYKIMTSKKINLDKKDLKLLKILDFNARETNSKIAKQLRISKPAVEYRINRLLKNNIVENFYTVLDISKIGFIPYRISIKLQDVDERKQKEILDYLKNNKYVDWVFSLGGRWDIALTICARNILEFQDISKEILHDLTKNIVEKTISIVTSIHCYPNKFIFNSKEDKEIIVGDKLNNYKLDEIDQKILLELSQCSRQSILGLSKKIKINTRKVLYRIKRLEKNKIILAYRANINTSLLGYSHYKIFLYFKNLTKEVEHNIIYYIKSLRNSIYFTSAVGIADMEFELKVKDPEEIYMIVDGLRKNFEGYIINFESILIRKEYLINYLPKLS